MELRGILSGLRRPHFLPPPHYLAPHLYTPHPTPPKAGMLELLDAQGRLIWRKTTSTGQRVEADPSALPTSLYTLRQGQRSLRIVKP